MTAEAVVTECDEELVERARAGDDDALQSLLERYRHYARAKAKIYFLVGADKEDIIQEGMIGLFKAVRDYRPDKKVAFCAFAELCITRQIITAIKAASRQKHLPLNSYVSINKTYSTDEDDDRTLIDTLGRRVACDPAELLISAEEIAAIKQSVSRKLSSLETEVLQLHIDGRSYQEIAETLGRHVKTVDNALQRIKRKLEPHVAGRDAEVSDHAFD